MKGGREGGKEGEGEREGGRERRGRREREREGEGEGGRERERESAREQEWVQSWPKPTGRVHLRTYRVFFTGCGKNVSIPYAFITLLLPLQAVAITLKL